MQPPWQFLLDHVTLRAAAARNSGFSDIVLIAYLHIYFYLYYYFLNFSLIVTYVCWFSNTDSFIGTFHRNTLCLFSHSIFFHPSPQFNVDDCQLREVEEAVNVPANVSGIAACWDPSQSEFSDPRCLCKSFCRGNKITCCFFSIRNIEIVNPVCGGSKSVTII